MLRFLLLIIISFSASSQTLTVVTEEIPPLQYIVDDQIEGRSTEIVKAILEEAGLNGEFYVFPWARTYNYAVNNKNTLIYPILRNENRENTLEWIGIIGYFKLGFVRLKERNELQIKSLEEVRQWRMGVMRDDFTHHFLIRNGFSENQHFILRGTFGELLGLLYARKIDTLIADLDILKSMAEHAGYDFNQLEADFYPPAFNRDVYMAVNLNTDPEIILNLKSALQKVRSRPEYLQGF